MSESLLQRVGTFRSKDYILGMHHLTFLFQYYLEIQSTTQPCCVSSKQTQKEALVPSPKGLWYDATNQGGDHKKALYLCRIFSRFFPCPHHHVTSALFSRDLSSRSVIRCWWTHLHCTWLSPSLRCAWVLERNMKFMVALSSSWIVQRSPQGSWFISLTHFTLAVNSSIFT